MSEFQVLSKEEVDEILKVTQEQGTDLSALLGSSSEEAPPEPNDHALQTLTELTRSEYEKSLSTFLRKKIGFKVKNFSITKLAACLDKTGQSVYTTYQFQPMKRFGVIITELPLLHQIINLLYGGQFNPSEPTIEKPGKLGIAMSEKIAQLLLTAYVKACAEYGNVKYDIIKTSLHLNVNVNLSLTDVVHLQEYVITIEETEFPIKFLIAEKFLNEFIPGKKEANKFSEKDLWSNVIKSQVADSYVSVSVNLPEVKISAQEFMALKEDSLIEISDPTLVYVCLNDVKLFQASAGQSNNKRVAKIISQIKA